MTTLSDLSPEEFPEGRSRDAFIQGRALDAAVQAAAKAAGAPDATAYPFTRAYRHGPHDTLGAVVMESVRVTLYDEPIRVAIDLHSDDKPHQIERPNAQWVTVEDAKRSAALLLKAAALVETFDAIKPEATQ